MKNQLFFLLPAMLVAWSVATIQAQTPSIISSFDASSILQKTIGQWHVKKSTWHPEIRKMSEIPGTAMHVTAATGIAVQEQFEFTQTDGTPYKEKGILRYSDTRHQFEFVTADSTGNELILFTGHWHSDFKTLLLKGEVHLNNRIEKLGEWRYIFLENGAFVKIVHYADKNGDLHLSHRYYYTPIRPVSAELK